jgi:hypothetical protein
MIEQLIRIELGRPHLLHQVAQVEHFGPYDVLQAL